MGIVVAVLNMKGGVGKTTVSAHVMRVLYYLFEKKVLLVDLDPQFNLTQCVMNSGQYNKIKTNNKTIFSVMEPPSQVGLFDVATTTQAPPSPSDIAVQLRHIVGGTAHLSLIPGNFDLVKYSLIDDHRKLEIVRNRFLQFISSCRNYYDVVVIDCNPSSSFITLCALLACTHLLVPVRPDRYSVLGLEILVDFMERIPAIHPKPDVRILLNGIPTRGYDPTAENELRAHKTFGTQVLTGRLRQSKLLAASPNYTGFATDRPAPHKRVLKSEIGAIAVELMRTWGI